MKKLGIRSVIRKRRYLKVMTSLVTRTVVLLGEKSKLPGVLLHSDQGSFIFTQQAYGKSLMISLQYKKSFK